MPKLTAENSALLHVIDGWHQIFEWSLLVLIAFHVAAAVVHLFYYHDDIMDRMLPLRFTVRRRYIDSL